MYKVGQVTLEGTAHRGAEEGDGPRFTHLVGLLRGGRGVLLDSLRDVVDALLDGVDDAARGGRVGVGGPTATWSQMRPASSVPVPGDMATA